MNNDEFYTLQILRPFCRESIKALDDLSEHGIKNADIEMLQLIRDRLHELHIEVAKLLKSRKK
jgi:hypothetical protein